MPRTLPFLGAALVLLAGCVAPPSDVGPLTREDPPAPLPHFDLTPEHDHRNASAHNVSWNVQFLGWNPVAPDASRLGRYNHMVVHERVAYVTAYHLERDGPPGLAVLDVSNDTPLLLGTLPTPDMTPIDVAVSPDGRWVFLAGHRDARFDTRAVPGEPCVGGDPLPTVCRPFVPAGVYVVDVANPARPVLVHTYPSLPSGAHTVKVHEIGGKLHVFIASYGVSWAGRAASSVEIAKLRLDGPGGTRLEPVSRFLPSRASGSEGDARMFVHDTWVEAHPMVGGKPLLYVAYWDGGVVVADVSDPARPRELSDWRDFDSTVYGNIHFVRPVGMVGERHITLAAPEFGTAPHAGEAYVLDTTDPAAPALLARWRLPGDPITEGDYLFSPHNFDVRGTLVAYAHYHGGVWILDLADPEAPAVKGYVFPVPPPGTPPLDVEDPVPNVWTAAWASDGTFYASDIGTGVYHYRVVSETPGTPPYEAWLAQAAP